MLKVRMRDRNMSQKTMVIVRRDGTITHNSIVDDMTVISHHRAVTSTMTGYRHVQTRSMGTVWFKVESGKVSYRTEGSKKIHSVNLHADGYGVFFVHRKNRINVVKFHVNDRKLICKQLFQEQKYSAETIAELMNMSKLDILDMVYDVI